MKLQVALDGTLEQATAILDGAARLVDIAEIGTPLIYREGMGAVRTLRGRFPNLTLLVDLKIMDAGDEEASIGFEAGGDVVTVLGVTQDATIRGAVTAARRYGKQVMADLMQVANPVERGRELLAMGCDYLCVHTAYDVQSAEVTPLATLMALRHGLPDAPLAAAGGIQVANLDAILALQPAIVIVGGAITRAANPTAAAQAFRQKTG
jgi:3-hexulose-6-phosphate synthase